MKIELFAKNMEVTDRINEYVNKKVGKLDRYLTDIEDIRIDLSHVKSARSAADRHVAQLTIHGKGYILRTEESASDLFTAVDASLDKMQRQIERFKGKRSRVRGDGTPASGVAGETETALEADTPAPAIVRRKSFTLVPMNEDEAIEQMALLGHENFFIFYNADTNAISVLYHRRDGSFGLIEPKIG